MTALDRTFIKAFRRRQTESDCPQPPKLADGESDVLSTLPVSEAAPDLGDIAQETATPEWQWPTICEELSQNAAGGFEAVAAELETLSTQGDKSVVALAGSQAQVGCTSVFLTLARALSERAGQSVLLIEANRSHSAMCEQLHLDGCDLDSPQMLGETGLSIIAVEGAATEISDLVTQYAEEYPLILIDAGSLAESADASPLWPAGVIDTAILVDFDEHDIMQRNSAVEFLTKHSGMFLGVIETHREEVRTDVAPPRMTG